MLTAIAITLVAAGVVSTNPPDISGNWQGEGWGQVTLKQTAPGEYTGTYTETVAKEKEPGKIDLKWSRIECRFNGTWREGDDDRFGDLSIRLIDKQIHGALTTDAKSKINPATPRLADLIWLKMPAGSTTGNAANAAGPFENATGLEWPSKTVTFDEFPLPKKLPRAARTISDRSASLSAMASESILTISGAEKICSLGT